MKIVRYPHPILSHKSKPVRRIDQGLRDIAAEMLELMYQAQGVGLAANQVGLPYQLLVMNPTGDPEQREEEYVFINPVIQKRGGGLTDFEEGCLSFPGVGGSVTRAAEVTCRYLDENNLPCTITARGFLSRAVQHEIDHLNGILYIDRMTAAERLSFAPKLKKLSKANGGAR